MARYSDSVILELLDSSDEDEDIRPPLDPLMLVNDNNEHNELRVFHPLFGLVQRLQHIKVQNYIENIVYNYDDKDFIMHFRLSRLIVYELINKFRTSIIFTSIEDRVENVKVSAEKHILCYLWFVGHETGSYRDVADRFGIALSTLYYIITRVTEFIMSLAPQFIRYLTAVEKEETSNYFREKGFPGIIGAIDGSHIRIDKPVLDADSYINRKQYFSIHLQGIVNQHLKFIDVFIGYPDSVHDARVFKNSTIFNDLYAVCGG
ncbi:putative nuclease HARBI1 isoform X2 [Ooceraea biroi]|uniref:putative nuclease HARBI1 isoform X2 n=1 Tax=Ooceraea biroi TaxID=2015173 RepID=UPI000F081673|nr:putative nuclease HARBI1 isoform X2 [Ooceraea biroi]